MTTAEHPQQQLDAELDRLTQRIAELESQAAEYQNQLQVLQARERSAQRFQEQLKLLNEISVDLDQTASFDEFCLLAIELGRSRLGFSRMGLWFLDDTQEYMLGSYGIDEHGQIRDERGQRFRADGNSLLIGITGRKIEVYFEDNVELRNDKSQVVGKGWSAAAALWDGNAVIGYISTDNLLDGTPPGEYQVELLRIYGATVGYLAKSKRAEQQVRKLSRAVDQSASVVMIVGPTGVLEYVNPRFTLVTGYPAEEVIGTAPRFLTSDDDYEMVRQVIASQGEWRGEIRNKRKNGEYYWALSSISLVKNPEGEITNYVVVQEDITELKQAQQQRLELAVEKEKVQLLANFIADITHEFKTPLSIINTGLYLLEKATSPEDKLRHLDSIKEQASAIDVLLEDMLTMARLDSASAAIFEALDLNLLIRKVLAAIEPLAREKELDLSSSLEDLPLIQGHSEYLTRAITEILHNAVQYTQTGGTISVEADVQENAIIIEVKDNGIGMNDDELPFIFDKFYRVDKARTVRGAGLGLSIAKKVIEAHRGLIDVTSTVDKGSVFRIVLPHGTA